MSSALTLAALYYLCLMVFFLLLIVHSFKNLRIYKLGDYLLIFYLGLSGLIVLNLLVAELGWTAVFLSAFARHLPLYGLLLLSGFLFLLTRAIFPGKRFGWWPVLLSLLLLSGALVLDVQPPWSPGVLQYVPGIEITPAEISRKLLLASWGVYLGLVLIMLLHSYRSAQEKLIKHRSVFWSGAAGFFIGGSVLFFSEQFLVGSALFVLSSLIFCYLVLTYRLPDLWQILIQAISHLTAGTMTILLYALGFLILERVYQSRAWYQPVYTGGFLALWTLVLYPRLSKQVQRSVQTLLNRADNRGRELRNFSRRISSTLDIDLLSRVTIDLICKVLDIRRGYLFLVDEINGDQGVRSWSLRAVKGMEEEDPPDLENLPASSPLTKVLVEEKRPLTQSELEMIPKYQTIPEKVLTWLQTLEVDTFVPIHTEDEWIGVFALSRKKFGASFSDQDLEFLMSLADQTSVALQNARLVENLTNIDHELRRSRATTNTALDRIARIKRSAADFISIKAHELRTPLTVMSGYTQLLANDEKLMEDEYYSRLVEGILTGSESLQRIIDSMLYTASIQPGSVEIDNEPISLFLVIDRISRQLQEKVQARKITLSHDGLSSLPELYGDSEGLEKVFRYLINYAMTHTPSGGKISITGRHLPLRSDLLRWEGVEVVIRDTGIGIDSEAQQRLFRDFSLPLNGKLEVEDQQMIPGERAGERLAVVRGIVEAHNGRIWVELLEKDKERLPGSEFHVVLPLQQQTQPTRPVESPEG
ncbi:MAG: GAF domain-containing sensor histidine kinase [Anaerolineales bacterium]|nr:GAF domain-containing sensor histidine kinase [Anaerolineales bacterium]